MNTKTATPATPAAEVAPAKDNTVEVSKRNRYHYCNDWDPAHFKAMAKECRDRAHRSFENSDTDGFMSQWANEEMARRYDHAAAIARDGHMKGKRVVLDLDGNIISDDERENEYGYYWFIPSREGRDRFFTASKALNEKTAIRNDAKKGCVMGYAVYHVTMNNSGDVEYGEFAYLDEETMDALQAANALGLQHRDAQAAEAETPAAATLPAIPAAATLPAVLPAIPAEATALAVDRWQDNGETIVAIHDRTGREAESGVWGEFIGHVTLREDATEEDAAAALRAAGWTEGDLLAYPLPGVSGTATTWTR